MEKNQIGILAIVGIVAASLITMGVSAVIFGGGGGGGYSIQISGSTTCFPVIEAAAEEFQNKYPEYTIEVAAGGSSKGVSDALEGVVDIGMASRNLKESEQGQGLIDYVFATDGIAVIASKGLGDLELTMEQLFKIYTGEITDWSAVSSKSGSITLYTRAEGSGTRASFEELVTNADGDELGESDGYINNVGTYQTVESNDQMATEIKNANNAIGYCGLAFASDADHEIVSIDGVEASASATADGTYPVARGLHMFTAGTPKPAALAFINYIMGPNGQAIVAEEDFVPLSWYSA
ncbi:MAG: putative Phosphate-binding protein PstS [Promethearchaeota archaeon]|nr:MAG: putative Phosphate-binding protein PstS [Candidatus Lokiarchaeota archaeon]